MGLPVGARLGPYEVIAPLGAGGMGEVYKAKDTRLDRIVAVKVLPTHTIASEDGRQRFEREARAISQLQHPNICTLFDVGRQGETDFLVMELVEGESLQARLTRGPLPIPDVLQNGAAIASALDRAHKNGIAHRDLKPGNVMLTKSGLKLIDFGLARSIEPAAPSGASELQTATAHAALTREGAILGTPQYMAPEQLEGKPADARTDVFALGGVLHEMVAGQPAFTGASVTAVATEILTREPPLLTTLRADCPPSLERVVRACLAKDPDERLQSAHDVKLLLEGLTDVPHASPTASRRRARDVGAVGGRSARHGPRGRGAAAQDTRSRGGDGLGPLPGPASRRRHLHRLVRGHHVLLLSRRTHAGVQRGRRRGHAPLPAPARLPRSEAGAGKRGRALRLLVAGRKSARLLRQ